jgi:hypothetical protein
MYRIGVLNTPLSLLNCMKQLLRTLFFVLLLYNCERDLRVDLPPQESLLVIWGTLHPDSFPKIHLTESYDPLTYQIGDDHRISDALVTLYENGVAVDTLSEIEKGVYKSANFKPNPLRGYFFRVKKTGYPDMETVADTIPEKPIISLANITYQITDNTPNFERGTVTLIVNFEKLIYQDMIGLNIYLPDSVVVDYFYGSSWPKSNPATCDLIINISPYPLYDMSCEKPFDKVGFHNDNTDGSVLRLYGANCILALYSMGSTRLLRRINAFNYFNTKPPGVDPFYEPIFVPIENHGGYGHVFCHNTVDTLIKL